jgi:hypothetical protein
MPKKPLKFLLTARSKFNCLSYQASSFNHLISTLADRINWLTGHSISVVAFHLLKFLDLLAMHAAPTR